MNDSFQACFFGFVPLQPIWLGWQPARCLPPVLPPELYLEARDCWTGPGVVRASHTCTFRVPFFLADCGLMVSAPTQ